MYIVGTRCGGYEFFCRHKNFFIWVGQRKESDFDVLLEDQEIAPPKSDVHKIEEPPNREKGSLYKKNYCPYLHNGILVMPKSFEYLSHSVEKKLYRMKLVQMIYQLNGEKIFVDDINKNNVGSFIFKSYYRNPKEKL